MSAPSQFLLSAAFPLDFIINYIINYNIKYRMGLGGGSAEEEEAGDE